MAQVGQCTCVRLLCLQKNHGLGFNGFLAQVRKRFEGETRKKTCCIREGKLAQEWMIIAQLRNC